MKLDLTGSSSLDRDVAGLLNEIAERERLTFTGLVDNLSRRHGTSLDWWMTELSCRNTYMSQLFLYCCYLQLVRELVARQDDLEEISVNSHALAMVLRRYLRQMGLKIGVKVKKSWFEYVKLTLSPFYKSVLSIIRLVKQFGIFRLVYPLTKPIPRGPIILVETFVYEESFKEDKFRDRHFADLEKYVTGDKFPSFVYSPSFYGIKNWAKTAKQMRSSISQFLLKEDLLTVRDLIYGLGHGLRSLRFLKTHFCYRGIDILPLLLREFWKGFGSYSSVMGLLNYRFAKRLAERKIEIWHVIDWFENQVIDHGMNAGFRKFFPDIPITGYQGFFAQRHYLCIHPTPEELKQQVIPTRIAVMGQGLIEPTREFCKELSVSVAPAFRYQSLWKVPTGLGGRDTFTVLAALPVDTKEAKHIIESLVALSRDKRIVLPSEKRIHFHVKPHPSVRDAAIGAFFQGGLPSDFSFVDGSFVECLDEADLVISSGSSSCMEALARGKPVIVLGNLTGLNQNPIPVTVPSDIWRLCYSTDEINESLSFFFSGGIRLRHMELGQRIREDFFRRVSDEGVRSFVGGT